MDETASEKLDRDLNDILQQNIEDAKSKRDFGVEALVDIQDRIENAPNLPIPKNPADYPQAVTKYFKENLAADTIEFKIPLDHIEPTAQENLLAQIGQALRHSIFEYCHELIDSIPDNEKMVVQLPIGETALDIRHSIETGPIHSIYVYVKKETGHIFIDIINPSHFDPIQFKDERLEGGMLLVDDIAAHAEGIDVHRNKSKVVTDPSNPDSEIVGTDSVVNINISE